MKVKTDDYTLAACFLNFIYYCNEEMKINVYVLLSYYNTKTEATNKRIILYVILVKTGNHTLIYIM